MGEPRLDEVGYWTEVKLEIVRKYAQAYSTIMDRQAAIRGHIYIDAFAGPGVHIAKRTQELIPGSPLNALNIAPPFSEFHFVDLGGGRADALRRLTETRENVFVYEGDCNDVLPEEVLPRAAYRDFRRALCLLDPYGLHLNWDVVAMAGAMGSVEVFLNFPVMDMNMNALWRDPEKVSTQQSARMDAFWGDHSWRDIAYRRVPGLFEEMEEKAGNKDIAQGFRQRLKDVGGFEFVPDPMPMRNTRGAVLYYLFFASPNRTGAKIVGDIFGKYRNRGA